MKSQADLNKHVVWTAVVTPLLADGKIDYHSLENLLNKQAEAGNGFFLPWSGKPFENFPVAMYELAWDFEVTHLIITCRKILGHR